MATVKILAHNLFAGPGLRKLEAGSVFEADEDVAERWVATGRAEVVRPSPVAPEPNAETEPKSATAAKKGK